MTKFLIWQRTENNKPNLFYKHIPNDQSLTVEPADLSLLPRSVVPSLNLADSCSGSCHSGRDDFSSCQISCRLPYLLSLEHQANLVKTFRILWYDWFRIVFKDNKTLLKNSWFNVLSLVEHLYAKQLWFKSTRLKRAFQKVLIISISSQDEKNHSKGSTTKLALPFAITSLYTLYV